MWVGLGAGLGLLATAALAGRDGKAGGGEGARLYKRYCVPCHGTDGKPRFPGAPDFSAPPYPLILTDDRVIPKLRQGGPQMPSFKKTLKLTQMQAIAAHMRGFGGGTP